MEKSSSKPRSKLSRRHPSKQPSQTKTSQQESPKVRRKLNSQDGALLRVKSDDSISPTRKEDNNIKKNVTTTDMIQCEDKVSIPDFLLYPRPAGTEIEVTWDWDLSQRRASPKEDKPTKCRTPVNQNKRSCKSNSPLMNNAPLTRRRRLLKKEMKSDSSQFTAELKVISERLKKAKENPSNSNVNSDLLTEDKELYVELTNKNSTQELRSNCKIPICTTTNILNEIKKESFKALFEDADEDCMIQCSQEIEENFNRDVLLSKPNHDHRSVTQFTSPNRSKRSPKPKLGLFSLKLNGSSPNRFNTPSKVHNSKGDNASNFAPRRSPRIKNSMQTNQNVCDYKRCSVNSPNAAVTYRGRAISNNSSSNNSGSCVGNTNDTFNDSFQHILESFMNDDMDILSQVVDVSTSVSGVKQSDKVTHKNQTKSVPIVSKKVNSVPQILTSKPQTRQSAQGCRASESCNAVRTPDMAAINITLNIHDDSEKPLQPNFDSSNQSNNDGKSTTICRAGPNKAALRMGLLNENLSEYEKSLSLEDDGFIDPNLCTILDTVESNALTDVECLQCTPPDSSTLRGPQQGQASSPFHCTPEEIEIKRIQALQKLHQHSLSLNASKGDTKPPQAQRSSSPCDSKTRRMDRKTSPPQRYTPEEIERKKQEARSKLQLKQKQQALLRTNKLVNSSSISLVQHAKNIKYPP